MIAASAGLLEVTTQPLPPQTVPALLPKHPLDANANASSSRPSLPMSQSVAQDASARFRRWFTYTMRASSSTPSTAA